jgi:hypothetical protein
LDEERLGRTDWKTRKHNFMESDCLRKGPSCVSVVVMQGSEHMGDGRIANEFRSEFSIFVDAVSKWP